MAETLNQRIRDLRKAKGLTQLELAQKLSITDKAVSKWEASDGNPDISLLPKLALIFDVSIDYLLTGKSQETISLDDMDENKRREYVIKNDDLDNFLKYRCGRYNYYDSYRFVTESRGEVYILNRQFWKSIFQHNAYKIFAHCIKEPLENCKKLSANRGVKVSYIEMMTDYISDFMNFVVNHDRADWLEALNFKFSRTSDNHEEYFKIGKSVVKAVDLIFENKDKCPKCLDYILDIEHRSEDKRYWYRTYLDDIIIANCLKYKLYDKALSLFDKFKKELLESHVDRRSIKDYKVSGSYIILRSDSYGWESPIICARCVTATKTEIDYLLMDGQLEIVRKLLEYNKEINKILKSKYLTENYIFFMTENDVQNRIIELDKNLTLMQKRKKIIENAPVLSISALDELWKLSITETNLNTCINYLENKYLTYYEYFYNLIQNKKWKELFKFAVDNDFELAINLFKEAKYDEGSNKILELSLGKLINNKIFNFKKYNFHVKEPDKVLSELKLEESTFKEKWINDKKVELARFNLVEKMNNITQEITKDYVNNELKKGNVELVIIKLCTKLEAQLSLKYNREDDLQTLLNEYCEKDLHWIQDDGWGYDECCSDDKQIKLLNKLRINRNNIVHPQKENEPFTIDELEKCIEYVFKI